MSPRVRRCTSRSCTKRPSAALACEDNPAGNAAPRLVDPQSPNRPACFAPIPQSWPARNRLLGGLNRRAIDGSHLDLPPAFDWSFYQAAPAEQRIPYLQGDEWLLISGLHPTVAVLKSQLPMIRAVAELHGAPGVSKLDVDLKLDTLHVDVDRQTCSVVFRGNVRAPGRRSALRPRGRRPRRDAAGIRGERSSEAGPGRWHHRVVEVADRARRDAHARGSARGSRASRRSLAVRDRGARRPGELRSRRGPSCSTHRSRHPRRAVGRRTGHAGATGHSRSRCHLPARSAGGRRARSSRRSPRSLSRHRRRFRRRMSCCRRHLFRRRVSCCRRRLFRRLASCPRQPEPVSTAAVAPPIAAAAAPVVTKRAAPEWVTASPDDKPPPVPAPAPAAPRRDSAAAAAVHGRVYGRFAPPKR